MSTFGDHTPAEELLEWIKVVQDKYNLSNGEIILLLNEVINVVFLDNIGGFRFDNIQRKRRYVEDD